MISRVFAIALAVSLTLLFGIIIIWVRSYYVADDLSLINAHKLSFTVCTGDLWVQPCRCFYAGPLDEQTQEFGAEGRYSDGTRVILRHHGPWPAVGNEECEGSDVVEGGSLEITYESRVDRARIPLSLIASLAALLPFVALLRMLRPLPGFREMRTRRRIASGTCPTCRYDLRASRGRCPECGAACKAASPAGVSPAAGD